MSPAGAAAGADGGASVGRGPCSRPASSVTVPAESWECSLRPTRAGSRQAFPHAGATPRLAASLGPLRPQSEAVRAASSADRSGAASSPSRPHLPPSSRLGAPATIGVDEHRQAACPGQGPRQRCLLWAGREAQGLLSDLRPVSSAWCRPGRHVARLRGAGVGRAVPGAVDLADAGVSRGPGLRLPSFGACGMGTRPRGPEALKPLGGQV